MPSPALRSAYTLAFAAQGQPSLFLPPDLYDAAYKEYKAVLKHHVPVFKLAGVMVEKAAAESPDLSEDPA